jgi:hypothetical protein
MGHRPPGRVGLLPLLLACGSALNIAQVCDRGIERRMGRRRTYNSSIRSPLMTSWSFTEHEIVDLAPLVRW